MAKQEFLRAKWTNLLMLNYEVDPAILKPHLPPGTILDTWQGKTLMSMVGFLFQDTRMLGVKWPFHINFEEINLRFYVRYFDGSEWKRGAVFISEIVPKYMIALIANSLYNEHYMAMPTRHAITKVDAEHTRFDYEWKYKGQWSKLGATVNNTRKPIEAGSPEEFIFDHYWGYNKLNETRTIEYQVEHITWQIGEVTDYIFDAPIARLYGPEFEPWLKQQPVSAFFADGSDVVVRAGSKFSV
ncbi:MAG: DUF2071 domain-containing protein [Bacteroidota bacterium]